MISGISAAMGAINTALEQFDRAILSTVTSVADPNGDPSQPGPVQVPDGLVGMDTARLAAQAALAAANASVSMLDEVIKMADYDHQNQSDASQPQQQTQQQSRGDISQTAGLIALVGMQSPAPEPEPAQPAAAPAPEEQFQPGWTQASE